MAFAAMQHIIEVRVTATDTDTVVVAVALAVTVTVTFILQGCLHVLESRRW